MTGTTTAFGALRVTLLGAPLLALTVGCASTQAPDVTHDGLVKIPESEFALVYAKPDVSVAGYSEFTIADCDVAFRKNWLRDQNSGSRSTLNTVGEDDVKRIREALSALCTEEFTAALTTAPEYKLVSMADVGANTLVLEPNIINLDISAPDTQSPGRTMSFTTNETGEMTLSLDVKDGTSGEPLFRVIDRRRSTQTGRLQWTNSVTNTAEAKRILRVWGQKLRQGLDQVVASPEGM